MTEDELNDANRLARDHWAYGDMRGLMAGTIDTLLAEVRRLHAENADLRAQIEGHCARIASQSDQLSRRAEKPT